MLTGRVQNPSDIPHWTDPRKTRVQFEYFAVDA